MLVTLLTANATHNALSKTRESAGGVATTETSAIVKARQGSPISLSSLAPALGDTEIPSESAAQESLNIARNSILGFPDAAMRAQANLNPQTVLELLAD